MNPRTATTIVLIITMAALVAMWYRSARSGNKPQPHHEANTSVHSFQTMGTTGKITIRGGTVNHSALAVQAIQAIRTINTLASTYDQHSELSRLNETAYGAPAEISFTLMDIVRNSLAFAEDSGGAFDPTVKPLVDLWKKAAMDQILPGPDVVQQVRMRVGYGKVQVDADAGTVGFTQPGVMLDLGGIAKGYAIDNAIEVLMLSDVTGGIVEIGGDLRCFTRTDAFPPWRVGIRNPSGGLLASVSLTNNAVATSGDYARYVNIAGQRFSHIIDPRSGRPVDTAHSVSVIAPSATAADAWATAFSVMGQSATWDVLGTRTDLAVYMVASDEPDATPKIHISDNWPE